MIFLGGTCEPVKEGNWRDELIKELDKHNIEYYNPIIWDRERTEEDKKKEIDARESADIVLYCITPDMRGVYSIAEVVDDSNKRPDKTVFYVFPENKDNKYVTKYMFDSLKEVGSLVKRNGGNWFNSYSELVSYLISRNRVEISTK